MHHYQHRSAHATSHRSVQTPGAENGHASVARLQRQIGNRAVQRLLRCAACEDTIARDPGRRRRRRPRPTCALTTYSGSNFTGEQVVADVQFVSALDAINKHAVDNDVNLLITDSFRPHGRPVRGAIVPPASRSNHLAGHAIDMNVMYGPGKRRSATRSALLVATRRRPSRASSPRFATTAPCGGGRLRQARPVHIDDHLNADDDAWKARYVETQKAHQNGCP